MSYLLVPNGPCAMSLSNSEWYSQFGYETNVRGVALAVATACACQSCANAPGCMRTRSLARAWTTDRVIKLSLPSALPRLRIQYVVFRSASRHDLFATVATAGASETSSSAYTNTPPRAQSWPLLLGGFFWRCRGRGRALGVRVEIAWSRNRDRVC